MHHFDFQFKKAVSNNYVTLNRFKWYLCVLKLTLVWVEFRQSQKSVWHIPLLLIGIQYKITEVANIINL